jgi:predicted transcriptional regulator
VVDETKKLLGSITSESINTVSTSDWVTVQVKELTVSMTNLGIVNSRDSLFEIWQTLQPKSTKQLTVVNDQGQVLGLLDRQSIMELIAKDFKTQTQK